MRRCLACLAGCALAVATAGASWSTASAASGQGVAPQPASAKAHKPKPRKRGCSTRRTRRARSRCLRARRCASRRWRARHKSRAKRCPKRRAPKARRLPVRTPSDPGRSPSGGTPAAPPGDTPAEPVRRVQVQSWEFYFTLSRPLVSTGSVKVELLNRGEDPHDLHLRREDGSGGQFAFGETPSAGRQTLSFDLTPGYWYLWCDLTGHEAAGMHARLSVE